MSSCHLSHSRSGCSTRSQTPGRRPSRRDNDNDLDGIQNQLRMLNLRDLNEIQQLSSFSRGDSHSQSNSRSYDVTRIQQTTTIRPQQPQHHLMFNFIVDTSSSMKGSKMKKAIQGLRFLYEEFIEPNPTSSIGVSTFGKTVTVLHRPMLSGRVDLDRDVDSIEAAIGKGTGTALYDAIGESVKSMIDMRNDPTHREFHEHAVYEFFVLTDGEDNRSRRYTLQTLGELLHHPGLPHFHLTIVGVRMGRTYGEQINSTLCCQHVRYVNVDHVSELDGIFKNYSTYVKENLRKIQITTTTVTVSTPRSRSSSRPRASSMPRSLSRPRLSLSP